MSIEHRFIFLVDLHLSDRIDTAAARALHWALEEVDRRQPDFLAAGGDITTYGTAAAATHFLEALAGVRTPTFFTPGNAELRRPEALPLLRDWMAPERRYTVQDDLLVLFPDTSTGALPVAERDWLEQTVTSHSTIERRIVITHYPLDKMARESTAWMEKWLARHSVELLVAGHSHFHRERRVDSCAEIVVRALDPDKAIGDLPGIALFESATPGQWEHRFIPWSPKIQLLPADLPADVSPVGWSIHGDPVEAARETLDFGLSCLELRPKNLDFSRPALAAALQQLRDRGYLYLSYHLPGLNYNSDADRIEGEDAVRAHLDCALVADVDSLTVHVPQAPAAAMQRGEDLHPSSLYQVYVDLYTDLFRQPAREGIRIAIENIHNPPATPLDSPDLLFATRIDQYLDWIETIAREMADIPDAVVGALFDIGHARNNGGELDNLQPLGDWYARLGRRILGYHIHQVDTDPQTGRVANHREIAGLFAKRISYAGFLWAWSAHQMNRAPLFIEVRDPQGRRNTTARFKRLFENAEQIAEALQLTGLVAACRPVG